MTQMAEVWFDSIDELWPIKRNREVKSVERERFEELVKNESDFERLKNKIEIEVADKPARKLPQLLSVIEETFKVTSPVIVSEPVFVPVVQAQQSSVSEVELAFETIFGAWPENDIKQNKKFASEAFLAASRKYGLEKLKAACDCYIQEQTDLSKASVNFLGIKRFVSTDEILERWIDKAFQPIPKPVDTAWFDSAWSWYPEFLGMDKVREDSLSFYNRFIKDDDVIDFWCAVRAYALSRKEDARMREDEGDYSPDDVVRFTKSFVNFIRCWKEQKYEDYLADLLIGPVVSGFKKRGIPYWCVYPEENHYSALLYNCKQMKGAVWVVNTHVGNVCNYLTTGKNYSNIKVNTPVDHGMISEVIGSAKDFVKKVKCK